jgi:exodeoxyribonuclease VII large subunit
LAVEQLQIPQNVKILSIAELTRQVKNLLEDGFGQVWVAGEISNLSRPSSGHIYLTLKDAQAQLRSVLWRSAAVRNRFELREGLQVIANGRLTVYPARGDYQLQIEELHPKGIGAAELALRQLKERLQRLGYFASQRKKPLPRFPRRVALVTSPSGAAVRDMLEVLGRRWPNLDIWVCPVRVQGQGAAEEVADAIRLVNRLDLADVIVVGRGGGSIEDLWAFNAECVAHALFESRIPVVSAVGHEIDLTIADLVADCRALTPSEAAERIVPDRRELLDGARNLETRLRSSVVSKLAEIRSYLNSTAQRRCFRMPLEAIRAHERRLDELDERTGRAIKQRLLQTGTRLDTQASRLHNLSPLNVLARGYSLTRKEKDRVLVRDETQVKPGDVLVTQVQNGQIRSRVE